MSRRNKHSKAASKRPPSVEALRKPVPPIEDEPTTPIEPKTPSSPSPTPEAADLEEQDRAKLESAKRYQEQLRQRQVNKNKTPDTFKDGIDADMIKKQRAANKEWLAKQEAISNKTREALERENNRSSDLALKVVLLVWLLIIAGIFWHIWGTIQQGRAYQAAREDI
eukprot:gb/GEZN01011915.1/.p1 GENE.gb/GEZN01011915.1/~~gb/GEZN01011915.1/.p1  ORF type:complete len:167 (-),score=24.71 gb/GEZN01011915.1/:397-897(-)